MADEEGKEESEDADKGGEGREEGEAKPDPDGEGEGEVDVLKGIVLTARSPKATVFNSPYGITVVGGDEIRERNSRTAAEALRYKAGIWIQKTGHLGGAPIVRGFMGNRVIYLFDGIRRNTAGLFGGPNSFLQNIDALDIDRIEVIRGPGSVLYGSDAIGGVINVITNEKPKFTKELKAGGRVYTRFASVDDEASARSEFYFSSPNAYGFIGGTRRDIDDLEGGKKVDAQRPSGWQEKNWDAQFNFKLNEDHEVELFSQNFSRPHGRRFDRPARRQGADRQLYGIRYRGKEMGFVKSLEVTAYYQNQERFTIEPKSSSGSKEMTWGVDVQATSFPWDNVRVVYGFHFHHDAIVSENDRKNREDPDVTWDNPAVFVLTEWQATERLRLDFGARWDRFTLKSSAPPAARLASAIRDAIDNGSFSLAALNLDETDNAITGGIGAVYSLTDFLNLVGHVGRAFRAPNKSDMLRFGQFTFGFNVPSTDLDPESSWTYEVGLRAQHKDFAGALTYFYTELDDAITSRPGTFDGASFIDVNGNGIDDGDEQVFVKSNSRRKTVVQGVELEGKFYLPKAWTECLIPTGDVSAFGNFTWIYGKDREDGEPLDRAFPANGLLGLRWEDDRIPEKRKLWFAAEAWIVRSFDRLDSDRFARDAAFRVDPQNKKSPLLRNDSVPGYTIFNIRGGAKITKNVTVTFGLENLTDKRFRVKDSRINGPGLNAVASMEITF